MQNLIVKHRNTFESGLMTDLTPSLVKPNNFVDAQNVSLVTNGQFFSMQNAKGTYALGTLPGTNSSCRINGTIAVNFQFGDVGTISIIPGVLVFGYDNTNFKIWGVLPDSNGLGLFGVYEMYQEALASTFNVGVNDCLIDAVKFSEFGYESVYFTDNFNEPRKINCIIPTIYSPNFNTATQIGLLQRKAIGTITGVPASGGSLITGTYQLAYQLYNENLNKYTRFSLLSNPIHIYTDTTSLLDPPKAGIGLISSSKITSTIVITADEAANYTHFRIAFVKNIYAEGADINTVNSVGVSKAELISTYTTIVTSDFTTLSYDIKSDAQYDATTIDEIVTDLLPVDHCKTLTIKKNRLLLGNISLKDVSYNNGTPAISGGSVLKATDTVGNPNSFTSSTMATKFVGHYRDEVYRYAIAYFDTKGNFSAPSTLDVSSVTDNAISGAIDMRFPSRNNSNYQILDSNNRCVSLGLRLNNITNHPKWAAGFIILRAKRKKRIQFQTPMLPVAHIWLPGAVGSYPGQASESTGVVLYPNATPVGPLVTGVAPNLFYSAFADTTDSPYSQNLNNLYLGETRNLQFRQGLSSHVLLFPPDSMYSTLNKYIFQGNETFSTVDAILTKPSFIQFSDNNGVMGTSSLNTFSGTFAATTQLQYKSCNYDSSTWLNSLSPDRISSPITISANKYFENLGSGQLLNGFSMLAPEKFVTPTISYGYPFTNHRMVAAEIKGTYNSLDSAQSRLRFSTDGISFFQSDAETHDANYNIHHDAFSTFLYAFAGGSYNNYPNYLNSIEIGNIVTPNTDTRYGNSNDFNEFIFTGTQVNFTLAEQATIKSGGSVLKTVDVWGGDCVVSYHTFKISDTIVKVVNEVKTDLNPTGDYGYIYVRTLWDRAFTGGSLSAAVQHFPVFYKVAAQYVTMALESEFNGSVRDIDTCEAVTTQNSVTIWGATKSYKARAPMNYSYNINLKKQNDQKIFVPLDNSILVQLNFKARVYYSDVKIYSSSITGFDTVRVNNYYDYEERYGRIVKLAQAGDNLYGIQDRSIFYLPLSERVLEATDASQIAVRTGDFLGLQRYLITNRGSQYLRSIVEQGAVIYGVDQINKQVFKIEEQNVSFISDLGMVSGWQNALTEVHGTILEPDIEAWYDYLKDELWVYDADSGVCYVYNEDYDLWASNHQFGGLGTDGIPILRGGCSLGGQLYLFGGDTQTPQITSMYNGNLTQYFGTYVTPSVSFIINPELEFGKTFDNMVINSTDRLKSLDLLVTREAAVGNQSMTTVDLTNVSLTEPFYRGGEGGYMLKTLRDSVSNPNSRMRGFYAKGTLKWATNTPTQVGLISVVTNARLSSKIF